MIKSIDRSQILNSTQVSQKIRRIAYEIYENNFKENGVVLAGVIGQGHLLAQLIAEELSHIASREPKVVLVTLNKDSPLRADIEIDCQESDLVKKSIILVDDVLNTGRTLVYALKPFLRIEVKKIEVAVLVNRSHAAFPILPQYTGYELSTTLTDHVEVKLGTEAAVYVH